MVVLTLHFFLFWCMTEESTEEDIVESTEDCEEFVMSTELQRFISGESDHISEEGQEELERYELYAKSFAARKRALQANAQPGSSQGVLSVTPKVQPQKARVRKFSRFKSSPFDSSIVVTLEQEEIYQKIMLSNKHQRKGSSNIKR